MTGGRKSRDKGNRAESGFVKLLNERGIGAQRIPLSGSAGGQFSGDVKVWTQWSEWTLEGKARGNGFKELYRWLGEHDGLFLKADYKPYLVVMTAERFAQLIEEAEG